MIERSRWSSLILAVLLLSLAAAGVCWDVARYRADVWQAFRAGCVERVMAFEEFAEDWISREDVRSLDSAARLLIMGSSLYVDVVARGALLVSRGREESPRESADPSAAPPERSVIELLRSGDVEVLAPISLSSDPGAPIGFLRIGFSGEYAAGQIRRRAVVASGVGVAAWLAALGVWAAILRSGRRRQPGLPDDGSIIRCGGLVIDTRTCEATLDGEQLDLTPKLYDLLLVLAREPMKVFSDGDLLQAVWPDSPYAASADVKQHIYLLRRKLASVHPSPKTFLETVKGFGYRLVPSANEKELNSS